MALKHGVTKQNSNKLQTFVNKCLRNIKKIRWPEKISNTVLWNQTNQQPINEEILKRKWGWIGHTLRKPVSNITRQALFWNPQWYRKVGRPRHTWRRSTDKEAKDAGMSWEQLKKTSQNRVRCKHVNWYHSAFSTTVRSRAYMLAMKQCYSHVANDMVAFIVLHV